MNVLAPILIPGVEPGIHLLDDTLWAAALSRVATDRRLRTFVMEGGEKIGDKDAYLGAASEAMGFPDYFGHNWDAFEECVRDLGWVPAAGYVLLYDHFDRFASADPSSWKMAHDILDSAVQYWSTKGIPFYVLLKGTPPAAQDGATLRWPELADPASPSEVRRGNP